MARSGAGATTVPGVSFNRAIRSKHTTYPELVDSSVLRLVVAAMEVGGRISRDATNLLTQAGAARAKSMPIAMQPRAARSWKRRWTTMLAAMGQTTLATTLVDQGTGLVNTGGGTSPLEVDVWFDGPA